MEGQQHTMFTMENKQELSQNFWQNQALSRLYLVTPELYCWKNAFTPPPPPKKKKKKKTSESGQNIIECFPGTAFVLLH